MRDFVKILLLGLFVVSCGDNDEVNRPIDAGRDSAVVDAVDAPILDALDAPMVDAVDAPMIDAVDAPMIDAGIDAATDASTVGQIQAARDTVDGTGLTLPIEGATVTYLKPALGNDPAGFTIQAAMTGPALFIAVDPATLTPPAVVGDTVSFTITTMASSALLRQATAITGYTRHATGANVAALSQELSAATDLVTNLGGYESELADATGTLTGAFVGAGSMFEKIQLATTGIPADVNLKVRVPSTLRDALDLVATCRVVLNDTPVGRLTAEVQLAAFVATDLTVSNCPAPTVVSAVASTPTTVVVTFSRRVLGSSVNAAGSQFTFDNGLTASAAVVSGRTVTLTTSAQSGTATYTVTVASTVTDLQGTALGTPNSAMFGGFVMPAVLRINEFNANIAGGCDLIELRAISGGSLVNFRLTERVAGSGELNFTFPAAIVATNDIVVVHLNSGSATCNPGTATAETTGPTQQPMATFTANYDTAWDFWNSDTGLTATDNVFTLFNPTGTIVDAVLSANLATGTAAAASETAAETVSAAGQWRTNAGGVPPANFFVDDNFRAHAALDLDGTGTAANGTSIQRLDDTDDNNTADWNNATITVQPHTFGLRNVGQNPL